MLLDTDVMVDVLRGHPPAVTWLKAQGNRSIGLPGLVAMELLQGCRNLSEQQRIEREFQRFSLHWPSDADCFRALRGFAAFRLGSNLELLDSLIAHAAIGLNEVLATFNLKHYGVMTGLQTIQPYQS